MLIEKPETMAYNITADVEEALMELDDIKDSWNRNEEIKEYYIDVCRADLKSAYRTAKSIEFTMRNLKSYLNTVAEVLNDRDY